MSMVAFAALVDHPLRHGAYSLPWSRSACSGHGDPMQHPPDHQDSICRKVLQSKGVHLRKRCKGIPRVSVCPPAPLGAPRPRSILTTTISKHGQHHNRWSGGLAIRSKRPPDQPSALAVFRHENENNTVAMHPAIVKYVEIQGFEHLRQLSMGHVGAITRVVTAMIGRPRITPNCRIIVSGAVMVPRSGRPMWQQCRHL